MCIRDRVKIRGNRVELGEVESRLRELDGVRQAAAVAVAHGGADTLLAFIVAAEPDAAPDVTELSARLAESVPEYMVPTRITVLDALPVSPNGKLDRTALKAHQGEVGAG